jgi:hypothetical protein
MIWWMRHSKAGKSLKLRLTDRRENKNNAMTTQSTSEQPAPAPVRVQPVVRVRAAWRDWCAGHVFLLEEYVPPRRVLWWTTKGRWENRTMATQSIVHAEEWCKHYGVKIEWDNGP